MAALRAAHAGTVQQMLTLKAQRAHEPADGEDAWSDEWKVLVYDRTGRDIISPLMRIGDLRKHGVTLHAVISDARDAIPDVPAVYFLRPTPENLAAIAADAAARKYKSQYVYFTTPVSRPGLQSLAQDMVAANASSLLTRVVDRYNDFVTLEDDLFTLSLPAAYAALHRPGVGKDEVMAVTHAIAQQLLCVCVTLRAVPVIQATTRGPEAAVATQLASMLRSCVTPDGTGIARSSVFGAAHPGSASAVTGHVAVERPLLLLLDRSLDLGSMLTHPSSYGGFIADTLGMTRNRTRHAPAPDAPPGSLGESVDLDGRQDPFWAAQAAAALPEAIEANDSQLRAVVTEENELRRRAGSGGEGGGDLSTAGLSSAMDGLPALLKRKGQLQTHTRLLQALMNIVTSREVPLFYGAEDTPTSHALLELLGVPSEEIARVTAGTKGGGQAVVNLGTVGRGRGTFADRVRATAMFLLSPAPTPLGSGPPSAPDAEGGGGPWPASDRTPAQQAFNEAAAVLRASAEAHRAAVAAAGGAGSAGGGFLSGGLWGSSAPAAADTGAGGEGDVDIALPPAPSAEEVRSHLSALQYLASHRALAAAVAGGRTVRRSEGGDSAGGAFWQNLTGHLSQAATAAVAGVKGLMGIDSHSLLTEVVGALADGKEHPVLKAGGAGGPTSMVLDPLGPSPSPLPPTSRPPTSGGMLTFVVGGGTVSEYYDLKKWGGKRSGSSGPPSGGVGGAGRGGVGPGSGYVLYGTTELLSAEDFLGQLATLGSGSK